VVRFRLEVRNSYIYVIVRTVIDSILSPFREVMGFFTNVQRDGSLKVATDLCLVVRLRVNGALTPLVYMLVWQEYTNFIKMEGLPQKYSS